MEVSIVRLSTHHRGPGKLYRGPYFATPALYVSTSVLCNFKCQNVQVHHTGLHYLSFNESIDMFAPQLSNAKSIYEYIS
jgi:hypothetical protein